jgi:O-antigen/teichoic acid export membrane protein
MTSATERGVSALRATDGWPPPDDQFQAPPPSDDYPAEEPLAGGGRRSLVGKNIAVLLASQVITWSLALVLTVAIPRYLGPTGVGQIRVGVGIWAIAMVAAELGTSMLLTLEFARDPKSASNLLRPVVWVRLLGMAVAVPAVIIFIALAGYDVDTSVIVLLSGVAALVGIVAEVARHSLYGLQSMASTATVDVIAKIATVVVVVGVLLAGGRTVAVVLGTILVGMLSGVLLWRALRARQPLSTTSARPSMVGVMRRSAPYFLNSAIVAVYVSIDIIIISLLATSEEAGFYATAEPLLGTLLFIPTATMTSLFPALAQVHSESPENARDLLERAMRTLWFLGVPVVIGAIVVADSLAVILFGSEFREVGPVIAVGAVAIFIMFQTIVLGRYAFVVGRTRLFNGVMFIAAAATLPLDLLFVPWTQRQFGNGAIGGSMSYVCTELFIMSALVWKVAPHVLNRVTAMRVAKCTVAGAALLAATWPLRDAFIGVPIAVGVVTFGCVTWLLRIPSEEELHAARGFVARVSAKVRSRRRIVTSDV